MSQEYNVTPDQEGSKLTKSEAKSKSSTFTSNNLQMDKGLQRERMQWALIGVCVLLLVVVIGLWLKTRHDVNAIEQDMELANKKWQGSQSTMLGLTKQEEEQLQQFAGMNDNLKNLEQQQQELNNKIGELSGHKDEDWLLREALYLSRLAVERVQTLQDAKTAIYQLAAADERLKAANDPSLLNIRQTIINHIAELKAIESPDLEGIWLKLGALNNEIQQLPLKSSMEDKKQETEKEGAAGEPSSSEKSWKGSLKKAWTEVKSMVKIRTPEENEKELNVMGKLFSLQEGAQLKHAFILLMEQARWAVIHKETWIYKASLETAQKWLADYFLENHQRQAIQTEIQGLLTQNIAPKLPDITDTVTVLSDAIAKRHQGNGERRS